MKEPNNQSGKGDKPRRVNKNQYDKNYDSINWGRSKKTKSSK